MPRALFVFKGEMGRLGLRIREMLNWNASGADDRVGLGGEVGIELLERLFGRDIDLVPRLVDEISETERRITELSEGQKRVLDYIRDHRFCVVQGGAGTGKTVVAVEKALRVVERDKRALFLCFNTMLRDFVERLVTVENRRRSSSEQVTVRTFHGFCREVTQLRNERKDDRNKYFEEDLPIALLNEVLNENWPSNRPELSFDVIIVDEGQDFADDWIETIFEIASCSGSELIIFLDDNQNIYKRTGAADLLSVQPIRLRENLRNTVEIFSTLEPYARGFDFVAGGPPGPSVRWIECEAAKLREEVISQITQLKNYDGVKPNDIVVLTGSALTASVLGAEIAGVSCHSVWSFKGLDSSVVVLTELKNLIGDAALTYVALSRARSLLLVIGEADQLSCLKGGL